MKLDFDSACFKSRDGNIFGWTSKPRLSKHREVSVSTLSPEKEGDSQRIAAPREPIKSVADGQTDSFFVYKPLAHISGLKMDFLDNVVKSSNALLKERLNNPFGAKHQQSKQNTDQQTEEFIESSTNDQPETSSSQSTNDQTPLTGDYGKRGSSSEKNSQLAAIAADAEAVTQKAVAGAKNIGSFLFSMANKAGQTVSQTAKQVKQAVENTSILTDLTREQQEFIKEHGGNMQAGDLPWSNIKDDESSADIREQVLSLSQDKRNFVKNPPSEANFHFDPQQCYPIALSLLKEDPNLSKMRFELVPKLVNENTFWRNYFYRVSLLRQMSEKGEDIRRQGWASRRSSSGEGPDDVSINDESIRNEDPNQLTLTDQAQQSFNLGSSSNLISSKLESSESRKLVAEADDLKSRLKELNIGSIDDNDGQDEIEKWEEELQKDLQEFELISGDVSALDEEALDKDIMELKKSTTNNIK